MRKGQARHLIMRASLAFACTTLPTNAYAETYLDCYKDGRFGTKELYTSIVLSDSWMSRYDESQDTYSGHILLISKRHSYNCVMSSTEYKCEHFRRSGDHGYHSYFSVNRLNLKFSDYSNETYGSTTGVCEVGKDRRQGLKPKI